MKLNATQNKVAARFKRLAVIFLAILIQAGCTTYEIDSLWRTDEINIDGKSTDWIGKLSYIEEANISVGIQNDHESLYLCLIAEHPFLRAQVMVQGMTVWFDPSGGKNKSFGIKFPLGRQFSGAQRDHLPMPREEMDREKRRAEFKPFLDEIEILYPEEEKIIKISKDEAKGIHVDLTASSAILVYELKVPLTGNELNLYAIGVKPGMTIGIGLEVPKRDMATLRNIGTGGMGGGMPGGGLSPPGGGRGGGMRGGGMGRRPGMVNGLKIWAATQLASEIMTPPSNQPPS